MCDRYNQIEKKKEGNNEYQSWKLYKKNLTNYLEKQKYIIKKDFLKYSIDEYNKNDYNFNYDITRINNFYYYWKSNSIKFTKYYLIENPYTFDNKPYLKIYKNKNIFDTKKRKNFVLEYFIFITDFFVNKIKSSKNIFIDGTFKKPDNFSQIIIIQFYHNITNKKYTGAYIIINSKSFEGYLDCLKEFKIILNKKENGKIFDSITIDFEDALYKACADIFPDSLIIGCYYHYKAALVRYLKKAKLIKKDNTTYNKELVSVLGLLPIYFKGDIDYINKTITILENDKKFKNLKVFFEYFRKEWIPKFENNMLYYNKIPKPCRANTSLENYNKFLKENLDYKKKVDWINLLNFLKNEEVRITNNLINDEKTYTVNNENNLNTKDKENIIKKIEENVSFFNNKDINWIKWKFNSCRYDVFITLYIATFQLFLKDKLNECNNLINSLNKISLELLHDNESYSRFTFWKNCDNNNLDVPDKFTSLYLKDGFISGLFSIYNNNDNFCIRYNIINQCYKCGFYKEKKEYSKCLINITEELLNFNNINNIIAYKYQYTISVCDECLKKNPENNQDKYTNVIDKKTGNYIKTLGINYENIVLPNFIIFISDFDYSVLKKEEIQKKINMLFLEEIIINNEKYKIRNIIFMPSFNHYTIALINIEDNLLLKERDGNKFYYYDDLNGAIIEKLKSDLNDFIEDHIGYIYIYSKI